MQAPDEGGTSGVGRSCISSTVPASCVDMNIFSNGCGVQRPGVSCTDEVGGIRQGDKMPANVQPQHPSTVQLCSGPHHTLLKPATSALGFPRSLLPLLIIYIFWIPHVATYAIVHIASALLLLPLASQPPIATHFVHSTCLACHQAPLAPLAATTSSSHPCRLALQPQCQRQDRMQRVCLGSTMALAPCACRGLPPTSHSEQVRGLGVCKGKLRGEGVGVFWVVSEYVRAYLPVIGFQSRGLRGALTF